MITKEQALNLHYGQELHCTLGHACVTFVGPRGGKTTKIDHVRVSGKCQIWKTRPNEFRVPVKFGMNESLAITHLNAEFFHLPQDCTLY